MGDAYLAYRRARFATRLPTDRRYTEGHFWLAPEDDGAVRVGFTRFATRMLGEVVEWEFEVAPGAPVERGQAIGWFEGFKAVSELYTPLAGTFAGANPELESAAEQVAKDCYGRGWLYRVGGDMPDDALDAAAYAAFLDGTIDRMTGRSS